MSERKNQRLNNDFFCDGAYYVITSSSLGGSKLTTEEIADDLLQSSEGVTKLLKEGIAFPLSFAGDCALDNCTTIVMGELSEEEEKNWVGKITSKLKVPCGKVIILAGGGDSEYFYKAISGEKPHKDYIFYDQVNMPEGDYLVELYCYINSMSFQVDFDPDTHSKSERKAIIAKSKYYEDNFKTIDEDTQYIIIFSKLLEEPAIPELSEDGWCGVFQYRD